MRLARLTHFSRHLAAKGGIPFVVVIVKPARSEAIEGIGCARLPGREEARHIDFGAIIVSAERV